MQYYLGTKYIWVVRLNGPRVVEVHEPGKAMRHVLPGEFLTAPGVLRNSVKVEALYDREAAHEATLRNLLQRQGYASLDAIRLEAKAKGEAAGKAEGKASALLRLLSKHFGHVPNKLERKIRFADLVTLDIWFDLAIDAAELEQVFTD